MISWPFRGASGISKLNFVMSSSLVGIWRATLILFEWLLPHSLILPAKQGHVHHSWNFKFLRCVVYALVWERRYITESYGVWEKQTHDVTTADIVVLLHAVIQFIHYIALPYIQKQFPSHDLDNCDNILNFWIPNILTETFTYLIVQSLSATILPQFKSKVNGNMNVNSWFLIFVLWKAWFSSCSNSMNFLIFYIFVIFQRFLEYERRYWRRS